MDLIAGNYSDSSDEDNDNNSPNQPQEKDSDSELDDVNNSSDSEEEREIIPLPDFELDSSGKGKSAKKPVLQVAMALPARPKADKPVTCRMFDTPVIERFSRIHPISPFVFWIPVILGRGYSNSSDSWRLGYV